MTQTEFAEFLHVKQAQISKWESGDYNFTINTLYLICDKLDLDLDIDIKYKGKNKIRFFKTWKPIIPSSNSRIAEGA